MNDSLDSVTTGQSGPNVGADSLFPSSDIERLGLRVTRAQFARLMGTSRQAVTLWTQQGRITVGADGRFDPRQAVAQLLRTGDPAKIRSRILAPLVTELGQLRNQAAEMTRKLDVAREEAEFQQACADEQQAIIKALQFHLELAWTEWSTAPRAAALSALAGWVEAAKIRGGDPGRTIADFLSCAPSATKERAGVA